MTMAMFHGTQPAQTGPFMPIIAGATPTGQPTMIATPTGQATMVATPTVPGTVVATPPVPGTVLATPSVPGTMVATPTGQATVIATPMECNPTEATRTGVNGTTYTANLVNVNQNVLEQPQVDLQSTSCTITQPLYNASDTLYNASDTMEDQNTHGTNHRHRTIDCTCSVIHVYIASVLIKTNLILYLISYLFIFS